MLPQLIPLSSQSPSTMQPYHVEFVEPLHSNNNSASSPPPIRTSTPYQVVSSPGFVVQIAQPEEVDGVLNEQVDLTTSSSSSSHNHVLLVDDDEQNADVAYEYEGEEENEEHHEKLGEEEDDVVILEDEEQGKPDKLSAEVIDVLDEEDYESDRVNELEEEEYESDEEMGLEYWKSVLSSSLIMEQVDEEEDEQQRMEEENIEVIEVDDDDDHPKGQRRSQSSSLEVIPQPIVLSVTRQYNCSSPSGEVSQMSSFPSIQERPPSSSTAYSRVRYECRHCDKIYKSVQRLRYHEQEHLPGGRPKPFLCGQCQKGFSSKKLLEQHKRVHTG